MIREFVKSIVAARLEEKGIEVSPEKFREACNGVEYFLQETIYESIDIAISNVSEE